MYRVLRPLDVKGQLIERGTVNDLRELSPGTLAKLLEAGIVSEVAAPPLKVLPGWQSRAAKLETIGIVSADQFLALDDSIVANALRISVAKAAAMKTEVRSYLTTKPDGQ